MTFEESLAWLYSTQQFGIKLGLDNIRSLLAALDQPQTGLSFFHVAGTNGKGSVCAMLDAILQKTGRRCGLYTSPHLVDFRERIRVNGEKIPAEAVAEGLTKIRDFGTGWEHSPTFFEIVTALAIWHFARAGCEVVVLETGMGGRLDATNAVTPQVSVITPIAFDHTQWLGNSLEEIAGEKAGIIKHRVPVASAPQAYGAELVLRKAAERHEAPITFAEVSATPRDVGLKGRHQQENAALAIAALEAAQMEISPEHLAAGLRDVCWPGRFQRVGDRMVLDGSHNPHASAHLVELWQETFGTEKAAVIFGALADKDYEAMLRTLEPIAREFLFVPVRSVRSVGPEKLISPVPNRVFPSVQAALEAAGGLTLVTGSLFLVGEAMEVLDVAP